MARIRVDENLFEAEQEVLQLAMADINNKKYFGHEMFPRYKILVERYSKLLKDTKKIFFISDSQGQILQRHQNEIQNLLDNANQGFLTFGRDLIVNRQYSAECVKIFNRKIGGIAIAELLEQGEVSRPEDVTGIFRQALSLPVAEGQAILRRLPPVFRIGDKEVRVECKLIKQPDDNARDTLVMMILTDITEKLRAEEQIRYLSHHDKLTALYNRAYIETVLPDLESLESLPLSIVVIDMNGLKLVNDVFGHGQGDRLLVAMAKALTKACRETDIIARWGGDEFLILLPSTDSVTCSQVCERIRLACSEVKANPIPLSAAFGTATREGSVTSITELFSVAENRMYSNKLMESREVRRGIITDMEGMLHTRCFEDVGHSDRVRQLAEGFAAYLGIEAEGAEMKLLSRLAALHDIGKVAIPKEILGKPGPLTPNEWEIVKSHSDIGYRMAQSIGELALADIILSLHEHWDGGGYPFGIKHNQIPWLARLFSLVDVFDVITHDRTYNTAMDKTAALREIAAQSGSQFDPELTKHFMDFMTKKE